MDGGIFEKDLEQFVSIPMCVFLDKIALVLRELMLSFGEVLDAALLSNTKSTSTYCRWAPHYFDDCIKLEGG